MITGRVTHKDMIDYIKVKDVDDYRVEDAELIIGYGDIEDIPISFLGYLLEVWSPKKKYSTHRQLVEKEGISRVELKNRIGEKEYIIRLHGLLPKIVKRLAIEVSDGLLRDEDRALRFGRMKFKNLMDIIDYDYDKVSSTYRINRSVREFLEYFESNLSPSLKDKTESYVDYLNVGIYLDSDYPSFRNT